MSLTVKKTTPKKLHSITHLAIRAILVAVIFVLLLGGFFCYMSYRMSVERSKNMVQNGVEDVYQSMNDNLKDFLTGWTSSFADNFKDADINNRESLEKSMDMMQGLADSGTDYELYVIGNDGKVYASLREQYIGIDLSKDEQTKYFLTDYNGNEECYLEPLRSSVVNADSNTKYIDCRMENGQGFVRYGIPEENYLSLIRGFLNGEAEHRRLGNTGHLMIVDLTGMIVNSYRGEHTEQMLSDGWPAYDIQAREEMDWERTTIFDEDVRVCVRSAGDCVIIGYIPQSEVSEAAWSSVLFELINLLIMASLLILLMIIFFRKRVIRTMRKVVGSLGKITEGDLSEQVSVYDSAELGTLSDGINQTVDALKDMIAREAARIDEELAFAKQIQMSAMPKHLPEGKGFLVQAGMRTAKEVGGDFYNVFMTGDNTLVFLIADVSGKGIPAALFMMETKAIIEEQVAQGLTPGEVFTNTNKSLCMKNEAEMFVTAWIGFLDIKSGKLTMANAGHNPFVYIHGEDMIFEERKPGFILGMLDDFIYEEEEMQLSPGDVIYLYTDGVTEARGETGLYGEERMLEVLKNTFIRQESDLPTALCDAVNRDVDTYTDGDEQTDDITMVCVQYTGNIHV